VSKFACYDNSTQNISIQTANVPALKEGEILVKVLCTSLCRSDIHTYLGKRIEKNPTILGHEIVGVIDHFGPLAPTHDLIGNQFKKGDKVTWAIYASSPEDELAKKGIPQKASDLFKYGHERITENNHFHGGLSEYIILRKNTPIVILKDELPNELATLINCSVATVAGAIRVAGDIKNKNIIVYGTGMLGIIACAMSSSMGANEVIAIDENAERLETSKEFGVTQIFLPNDTNIPKVDIVFEFSGANKAMEDGIKLLHIGGTLIFIGAVFAQPPISINAEYIIRNILTIKGLHNYNNEDFIKATQFMEQYYNSFPFTNLIKRGFELEDTDLAFQYAIKNNPFRVSIDIK
jgi:alcohol dehydrogenase